jgi:hypothetical protein
MTRESKPVSSNDITSKIFGPPPILEGEDAGAYEALLKRLWAGIMPTNIVEQIWIHDLAALTWEILRWRKIKMDLVQAGMTEALAEIIKPFIDESADDDEQEPPEPKNGGLIAAALQRVALRPMHELTLAEGWAAKDPTAVEAIDTLIADGCFTMEQVRSAAFFANIEKIERIDHRIANAESRRNEVLREIDRRRERLARAVLSEVEEAEFETFELKAESPSKKDAA